MDPSNERRYFRTAAVCISLLVLLVYLPYLADQWTRQRYSRDKYDLEENLEDIQKAIYRKKFLDFTTKYKRVYSSVEETLRASEAYIKNMMALEEYKAAHPGVSFGENDMSDWTDEEFAKSLLPKDFYKRLRSERNSFIRDDPPVIGREFPSPDHFDWRAYNMVTPAKAQGKCGSCWAFAATATVEAAWAIGHGGEHRNLSEQTLLDCNLANNACNGGDEDKAFRFIHREGLAYAADYPYVAHRQNTCLANSNRTKLRTAYFLHPDEKSMIDWLVNFGPVNIGMSVIQPMRAYKGGVFHPSVEACKHEVIGLHALLIVGYGTSEAGEKYWIVKNSWGYDWGVEHGYIYFARGFNACFIEDEPVGVLA